MKEQKIVLSKSCEISIITYENLPTVCISIEYTEHSPAYGYGDTETSVHIDRYNAVEIVKALTDAFDICLEERS